MVKNRDRKSVLPEKICVVCHRPFRWRKKWARDWDAVKCCSDGCRKAGASSRTQLQDRERTSS